VSGSEFHPFNLLTPVRTAAFTLCTSPTGSVCA
jgi:hypothetical protein